MIARWVAVAILLVTVALVGIFAAAVLRPPTATSTGNGRIADAASGAIRLAGRAGAWTVTAELTQGPASSVAIIVSVADTDGRGAAASARPMAVLQMIDMAMGPQPVLLAQDAPGRWRGSGRLAMGGRWSLQIDLDGARVSLPFEVALR